MTSNRKTSSFEGASVFSSNWEAALAAQQAGQLEERSPLHPRYDVFGEAPNNVVNIADRRVEVLALEEVA